MALKSTKNTRLVIISGLSGSGKSTALKAFEDIGFFCIDNLPATLLPRFLDLKDEISKEVFKIALVMDLRGKDFLTKFPKIYQEIKRKGTLIEILFLYAEDEVLARRFSQTRRHHPLGDGQTLSGNIQLERRKMAPIQKLATYRLDTSNLNVHQLREVVDAKKTDVFEGLKGGTLAGPGKAADNNQTGVFRAFEGHAVVALFFSRPGRRKI